MSAWGQAWSSLRAHRASMAGPFVVLVLAGALLSATGVLMESGLRTGSADPAAGMLSALAGSFAGTALLVVVLVVAATVTLALRQRRREFALLRAVGATSAQVRRRVAAEVVLLTAIAGTLGAVPGLWLARRSRPLLSDAGIVGEDFRFALSPTSALSAVALLVPLSVLAARLATRETLRMSPTAAVRSTATEGRAIGTVRRALAAVTAGLGLLAAASPLVVPGTIGGATATTSALLLVGAAALAGPVLVTWLLDRVARVTGRSRRPGVRLAVANSRGFSRRLATAVVPLAAALALGTVQSSANSALTAATEQQLRDGIHADHVVFDPAGVDIAAVAAAPGVSRTTSIGSVVASVRTDDEEVPGLSALSWEAGSMRVLPAGAPDPAFDPGVVGGSLAGLAEPDTVAVSSDARLETGHGLGDRVLVRFDGTETPLRVVAVYDRGLGFGDYLVGAATLAAHDVTATVDTVLVTGSSPGPEALTTAEYAEEVTASGPQEQRLSLVLLLVLLGFVGVAAADTLVMTTAGRRAELGLLARTGATRRQLVAMAAVESMIVAAVAWAIGTVAVVPAVIGASAGLVGATVPVVDLATYGGLSLAVLGIAVLAIVPTATRAARTPRATPAPARPSRRRGWRAAR